MSEAKQKHPMDLVSAQKASIQCVLNGDLAPGEQASCWVLTAGPHPRLSSSLRCSRGSNTGPCVIKDCWRAGGGSGVEVQSW